MIGLMGYGFIVLVSWLLLSFGFICVLILDLVFALLFCLVGKVPPFGFLGFDCGLFVVGL